eukprot:SAG31_NODE_762_length_12275_cov_14.077119_5_plen_171_part_00
MKLDIEQLRFVANASSLGLGCGLVLVAAMLLLEQRRLAGLGPQIRSWRAKGSLTPSGRTPPLMKGKSATRNLDLSLDLSQRLNLSSEAGGRELRSLGAPKLNAISKTKSEPIVLGSGSPGAKQRWQSLKTTVVRSKLKDMATVMQSKGLTGVLHAFLSNVPFLSNCTFFL